MPVKAIVRINQKIARFEKSVRDHEMKGGFPPEDRDDIQYEYEDAKKSLKNYITMLLEGTKKNG